MSEWTPIGHMSDEGLTMSDNGPVLDRGAVILADLAFIETQGTMAVKTRAAIWAYLWAVENARPMFDSQSIEGGTAGWIAYPSLDELRQALARRQA